MLDKILGKWNQAVPVFVRVIAGFTFFMYGYQKEKIVSYTVTHRSPIFIVKRNRTCLSHWWWYCWHLKRE